jgi:hypothetical protein
VVSPASIDVPILDELGAEFRELVAFELGGSAAAPRVVQPAPRVGPAPRPDARPKASTHRRHRRRTRAPRIARRAAIVLVLVCLVGTGALAARVGLGGHGVPSDSDPVVLGDVGQVELSAHRHAGRLCLLLALEGELSDQCGTPPPRRGLRAGSIVAGGRVVAGFAGAAVARVRVEIGGRATVVATRVPADPGAASAAGVPTGVRWFASEIHLAGRAQIAPARLVPLDRTGRRLSAPVLDCSASVVGGACEHIARRAAQDMLEDRHG